MPSVGKNAEFWTLKQVVYIVTSVLQRFKRYFIFEEALIHCPAGCSPATVLLADSLAQGNPR
jgi:hypothetical protein